MNYHGLVVKNGDVILLCNGRDVFGSNGIAKNRFVGSKKLLRKAIIETVNDAGRYRRTLKYIIPQTMLGHRVTCPKCKLFLRSTGRKKFARRAYRNSPTYLSRRCATPKGHNLNLVILGHKP